MQTWWVIVPWSEKDSQSLPGNASVYEVDDNTNTYQGWINNTQTQINYNGQPYTFLLGPFNSQQEAAAAAPQNPGVAAQAGGIAQGAIGGLSGSGPSSGEARAAGSAATNIASAAASAARTITGWTEALGKILGNILSPHFWIRGGEIVLGLFLIIWGAALFMRKDVTQLAQSIPLGKTV